jgi:D-threo-aldose 1-dehydrogenase
MTVLRKRTLKTRSGRSLAFTELGFGTAPLGNIYRAVSDEDADETMAAAWTAGIRYYDTAPLYGRGLAETRLNHFLRGKPRTDYLLSTKVGRLLKRTTPDRMQSVTHYFDTPSREVIYDYGYDGVMRSVEMSLERMGVDRFDILYAHDLGADAHGSREASDRRLAEFLAGGYKALAKLRSEGVVDAIGTGCNEWEVCEKLVQAADIDIVLLAGRYTLLEQGAIETFLPLCEKRAVGVVVGGPLNSGLLAGGKTYNYRPATPDMLARAQTLKAETMAHGVDLIAAALRFPLAHPAVVTTLVGGVSAAEIFANAATFAAPLPASLWTALKQKNLVAANAPTPS